MERALMIIFFVAMMICGCSVESFFDGGAPVAILALLVAIACAVVLGHKQEWAHRRAATLHRGPNINMYTIIKHGKE